MSSFDVTMPSAADLAGGGPATVAKLIADTGLTQAQTGLTQAQTGTQNAITGQTQQQTANLAAQNPGMVADSASKTRDLAGKVWLGQHVQDIIDPTAPKDANGSPQIDFPKAVGMLQAAGYGDQLPTILKSFADVAQANIKTASDAQTLASAYNKTATDASGIVAQRVEAAPVGMKLQTYDQGRSRMLALFGPGVVNENTFPETMPQQNSLDSWTASARNATMTPKDNIDLANQTKMADAAVVQAQNQSRQTNMNAAGNVVNSQANLNKAGDAEKGAVAVANIPLTNVPSAWGSWAAAKQQAWLEQNPEQAAVNRMIAQHNADFPGAPLALTDGNKAIQDALHTDAVKYTALAKAHADIARAGGIQNVPEVNPQKPTAVTETPHAQTFPLIGPSGKTWTFPNAAARDKALATGKFKQVGQ